MRPKMNKLSLVITMGIFMLTVVIAMPLTALAIQPDAEYLVREKQFGKQWAAEDKQVREKLAALEKKFGKKPNIIFILADDIGYTRSSGRTAVVRYAAFPRQTSIAWQMRGCASFPSTPSLPVPLHAPL